MQPAVRDQCAARHEGNEARDVPPLPREILSARLSGGPFDSALPRWPKLSRESLCHEVCAGEISLEEARRKVLKQKGAGTSYR